MIGVEGPIVQLAHGQTHDGMGELLSSCLGVFSLVYGQTYHSPDHYDHVQMRAVHRDQPSSLVLRWALRDDGAVIQLSNVGLRARRYYAGVAPALWGLG